MKKSLINIALTMAFGSAIFSGTIMSAQAYAGDLSADNTTSNDTATETYLYTGMGAGAASGALVAGPAGMLVGGLIGAIAGASQQVSPTDEAITTAPATTTLSAATLSEPDDQPAHLPGIRLAQLGEIKTVVEQPIESQQETLLDILTADLSLDIYFRSGSTDIEAFYPARLAAIAELMNTMNDLEIHLDGYTDRRGDKTKNIALANKRIEKVREQLIDAGVNENRIVGKAFGEMKMVSKPGDLEAYTFDRKVVIRFQRMTADSISSMTTALSELKAESKPKNSDAVVADSHAEF